MHSISFFKQIAVGKDVSMNRIVRKLTMSGYMGIIREEITEEIEGKPGLQKASRM